MLEDTLPPSAATEALPPAGLQHGLDRQVGRIGAQREHAVVIPRFFQRLRVQLPGQVAGQPRLPEVLCVRPRPARLQLPEPRSVILLHANPQPALHLAVLQNPVHRRLHLLFRPQPGTRADQPLPQVGQILHRPFEAVHAGRLVPPRLAGAVKPPQPELLLRQRFFRADLQRVPHFTALVDGIKQIAKEVLRGTSWLVPELTGFHRWCTCRHALNPDLRRSRCRSRQPSTGAMDAVCLKAASQTVISHSAIRVPAALCPP